MQSGRRLAIVAVLGILGVLVLSGCRSQPRVAAYVGNTRYTEAQVDKIITNAQQLPTANLPEDKKRQVESQKQQILADMGTLRRDVVSALVLGDLGRRIAADRHVDVPPVDYAAFADQFQALSGAELTRVQADWIAVATALVQTVQPKSPTEADIRAIFNALRASNRLPAGATLQDVAAAYDNARTRQVVGLRDLMAEAARQQQVTINPRYRPLTVSLGDVPLPLAVGSDVVTDVAHT
jgi:outer membrane murein-binding lipoprotein Lpp